MDINIIFNELAQYMRMSEEINAVMDGLKDQIKDYMVSAGVDTVTGSEHKATYKTVSSSRVDTKALKAAHPDIATAYTVTTENKRFTFA
jgi:predicted phage-related endonuclease